MSDSALADFAILMCVYNGQKYLRQQLESIQSQSENNWRVHISDDGSGDQSLQIIKDFQSRTDRQKTYVRNGPGLGFSRNFLSLLTDPKVCARYYALCDQDDIWESEKLSAAKYFFLKHDPDTPALYCGRTLYVDENNQTIGLSSRPTRPLSFRNALVQNIASGNTMVLNEPARQLLVKCGDALDVYAHDWLVYMLVCGVGGRVFYDTKPYVRYRQHGENLIGMNSKFKDKIKRISQLTSGEFSVWNRKNILVLEKNKALLTSENKQCLDEFTKASHSKGISAMRRLFASGAYRQKAHQDVALYFGACFGLL